MRIKWVVMISSLLCAFIVMSGGYGFWQKQLTITGRIEVRQEPVEETALIKSTGIAGGGGGNIAIPNMAGDQMTDTETAIPISQGEEKTDENNGNETIQGEITEAADNSGQQQSTDVQDRSIGDVRGSVTVDSSSEPNTSASDSSATPDSGTSDNRFTSKDSSGNSAGSVGATSDGSGSDSDL